MQSVAVLMFFLAVSAVSAIPRLNRDTFSPARRKNYNPLAGSSNTITLSRRTDHSSLRRRAMPSENGGSIPITNLHSPSNLLIADIKLGDRNFLAQLDSESSELTIASKGFQCLDQDDEEVPLINCDFEPLYVPGPAFQKIPDKYAMSSFVDVPHARGIVGNDIVTTGGVQLYEQGMALKRGFPHNVHHDVPGVLGFAFPSITEASIWTDIKGRDQLPIVHRDPLFFTMFKQGLVDPVFAMVLEPSRTGSSLTLGGVPNEWVDANFTTVPLIPAKDSDSDTNQTKPEFHFYTVKADSFSINGEILPDSALPIIVDRGSSVTVLPNSTVTALYEAFDPPVKFDSAAEAFLPDCDAKLPELAVTIGGTSFPVRPEDLITRYRADGPEIFCLADFVAAADGDEHYIVGDSFMKSVVSVFDVGNLQMHFTSTVDRD